MRYEDAVEIERLATEVFEKRQAVQAMRMMNTPTDLVEQGRAFVQFQMAEAELLIVEGNLRRAQGQLIGYGKLRE